jgi:hypothetical protein
MRILTDCFEVGKGGVKTISSSQNYHQGGKLQIDYEKNVKYFPIIYLSPEVLRKTAPFSRNF